MLKIASQSCTAVDIVCRHVVCLLISVRTLGSRLDNLINATTLSGTIPPSLLGLVNLTVLVIEDLRLVGEMPPGVFELPKLKQLSFDRSAMKVVFPATVSPKLLDVYALFRPFLQKFFSYVFASSVSQQTWT